MKVTVKVRPTGLYNGQEWPAVGESMDLPDLVADSMIGAGLVVAAKEAPKTEKRPASTDKVETRKAAK